MTSTGSRPRSRQCEQPAEAASDDDDAMACAVVAHVHRLYSPGLECMIPPSAKTVVAVR